MYAGRGLTFELKILEVRHNVRLCSVATKVAHEGLADMACEGRRIGWTKLSSSYVCFLDGPGWNDMPAARGPSRHEQRDFKSTHRGRQRS